MTRLLILVGLALWVGATLVLSELRWFRRAGLADRLRIYTAHGFEQPDRPGLWSVESFRDVVAPLARSAGQSVARIFGVSEELSVRLRRIHSPLDVSEFRVRQMGVSLATLGVAVLGAIVLSPGPIATLLFAVGAPILAFLLLEQRIAVRSERHQRRIFLELPIVAEQLGMLLTAGYSLGSALQRIAARGNGACARDLRRVVVRVRQGLSEDQALREWAALADVDALDQLVAVLSLNREAGDLGRLIHEEARTIRREVQRRLIETIERRSQQVWIPVTVATLLPGVLLIAVPFIDALQLFSNG